VGRQVLAAGPVLTAERRAGSRYPIHAALRYRLISARPAVAGAGSLVNISRCGLLIEAEEPIAPGARIEIEIDWPARALQMILHLVGETVRSEGNRTAVRILRSAFRVDREKTRAAGSEPRP